MLIPANYFLQIVRGIVLRGASIAELWQPIAWLSFYMVVIIGAGDRPVQEDRDVAPLPEDRISRSSVRGCEPSAAPARVT